VISDSLIGLANQALATSVTMKNTDVDTELQAFIDADDGAVPSAEEEKAALF